VDYPDYLVIGTVCQDLVDDEYVLGGTVAYSGLTARNLGCRTAAISSFAADFPVVEELAGIEIVRQPSPFTTTYQNVYVDGHRQQFVRAVAERIPSSLVPDAWRHARIVHIGPLAQEVDSDIIDLFPDSLIGVTPQGWMRQWDENGRVTPRVWRPPQKLLQQTKVLIISEDDVGGDLDIVDDYARLTEIVVVTSGWKGSSVYAHGKVTYLTGRDTREVDPTGAGDVYAAAFLVRLDETKDPIEAACFANCVASISVERKGIGGIPTLSEVAVCRRNSTFHHPRNT
jgi:sugar/nucleoside kinase (ribokinase family)